VHVFRVAGIYGPGRSALDTVSKYRGDLELCGGDDVAFISRVHVSDISNILRCSMRKPVPGSILNIADDFPSTRYEVIPYLISSPTIFDFYFNRKIL
jgi:hypothetical protein